jgi:hypothetical protein
MIFTIKAATLFRETSVPRKGRQPNYAATLSSTTPPVLPNSANVLLKMTDNGRGGKHNIQ